MLHQLLIRRLCHEHVKWVAAHRSLIRPSALDRDLGFGSLALRPHYRLLNSDGSFNVRRLHEGWLDKLFGYHALINLRWTKFFFLLGLWYMAINALFAFGYLALGPGALQGSYNGSLFWRAFFFSIHTFATVGYGNIVPVSFLANALVAMQTLFGLLSLAVATGLVFARFSRPNALVLYSRLALFAPITIRPAFNSALSMGGAASCSMFRRSSYTAGLSG